MIKSVSADNCVVSKSYYFFPVNRKSSIDQLIEDYHILANEVRVDFNAEIAVDAPESREPTTEEAYAQMIAGQYPHLVQKAHNRHAHETVEKTLTDQERQEEAEYD